MNTISDWECFFINHGVSQKQTSLLINYIQNLNSKGFPIIFEFEHLARILGYNTAVLAQLTINTTKSYRSFFIPKKRGGQRLISSPYPALAACQKWILDNILLKIDLGPHSYAFRRDRNIIANASIHLGNEELLKLDIENFFGSIKIERIISIFKNAGYTNSLSYHLASICCLEKHLPQGACTSPTLSNIITKRLDMRLHSLCKKLDLSYSRYADDITISGKKIPNNLITVATKIIEDEGFLINNEKTVLKKKNQKKIVTGLCITGESLRVSKDYRRKFRQESHYFIKNGMSLFRGARGEFDPLYIYRLIGQANFILLVEPDNEHTAKTLRTLKELLSRNVKNKPEEINNLGQK